jgi:MYXO-CTERM domain-containing protein
MTMKTVMTIAGLAICAASAHADFSWIWNRGDAGNYGINDAAGRFTSARADYTPATNRFGFSSTFSDRRTDGYWLVVSPGANPKGHAGELALLYVDLTSAAAPVVTAYNYNGENGFSSFRDGSPASGIQPADKIASTRASEASGKKLNAIVNVTNVGQGQRIDLVLDTTLIQNHNPRYPGDTPWTGLAFGQGFGIWWHPVKDLTTGYGNDGFLTRFDFCEQGWFDGAGFTTVPTPGAAALVGMGAVAAMRRRRK